MKIRHLFNNFSFNLHISVKELDCQFIFYCKAFLSVLQDPFLFIVARSERAEAIPRIVHLSFARLPKAAEAIPRIVHLSLRGPKGPKQSQGFQEIVLRKVFQKNSGIASLTLAMTGIRMSVGLL
jgi:hypothetical protein